MYALAHLNMSSARSVINCNTLSTVRSAMKQWRSASEDCGGMKWSNQLWFPRGQTISALQRQDYDRRGRKCFCEIHNSLGICEKFHLRRELFARMHFCDCSRSLQCKRTGDNHCTNNIRANNNRVSVHWWICSSASISFYGIKLHDSGRQRYAGKSHEPDNKTTFQTVGALHLWRPVRPNTANSLNVS